MSSLNKVQLIGHLGKDPEIRDRVVSFSLVTSESWKDKISGDRKEKTEWHKIVIFNERLANVCERYLKKGSKIYVEGGLQTRKWTNQQGQDVYTTEVVLSKFKGDVVLMDSAPKPQDTYDDLTFRSAVS